MKRFALVIGLVCFLAAPGFALTESETTTGAVLSPFELSWLTDSLLTGTGAVVYGTSFLVGYLSPAPLGVDSGNSTVNWGEVNGFDRLGSDTPVSFSPEMDLASDITLAIGLASPAILGCVADWEEIGKISLMYVEAFLLSQGVKELVKASVVRYRPYTYDIDSYSAGVVGEKKSLSLNKDAANSFFSGHATMSFMAATFTTTVFAEYFPGNPWGWAVGIGSYALACTTTALRVAGGNHFPSDVLAGAAFGSLVGWLVPFLHTLGGEEEAEPQGRVAYSLTSGPGSIGIILNY